MPNYRLLQTAELVRTHAHAGANATKLPRSVTRLENIDDPGAAGAAHSKASNIATLAALMADRTIATHRRRVQRSSTHWTRQTPLDSKSQLIDHYKDLLRKMEVVDIWSMEVFCPIEKVCHLLSAVFATAYCL
jgi:hypothetical protein